MLAVSSVLSTFKQNQANKWNESNLGGPISSPNLTPFPIPMLAVVMGTWLWMGKQFIISANFQLQSRHDSCPWNKIDKDQKAMKAIFFKNFPLIQSTYLHLVSAELPVKITGPTDSKLTRLSYPPTWPQGPFCEAEVSEKSQPGFKQK